MDRQEPTPLLVAKAQRGDREAFEQLVTQYWSRLAAVIHSLVGGGLRGHLDVEDVCQEVSLRAFQAISDFSWQGSDSFFRWLSVIGRNVVLEAAKRRQKEQDLVVEDLQRSPRQTEEVSPSRILQRVERFDRFQEALGCLTPEHREVISLARLEKLPLKEVATRMNRSHAAIRQLLRRALQSLKEKFGDTESLGLAPGHLDREAHHGD